MTTAPPFFLQDYQFSERHDSEPMAFTADAILAKVETFDMRSDWVTDLLLTVREWPTRLQGLFSNKSPQAKAAFGLHTFTLLQRSSNELSLGLVGKFWRPDMGLVAIPDVAAFKAFNDHSAAKLVLRFQVTERPGNTCILRTETFIYCPTPRTKRLFLPYWIAIRAASGWIRKRTLKLIHQQLAKDAAEARPPSDSQGK
ncbi:hypothetical protein [Leeia oryzae]|uniref:hypothetical protein n=1 Tax=Leeia oryzae TaxID=356662 RepID=UPI00039EC883|nr:hypothetical protein [Leeia oryzae]